MEFSSLPLYQDPPSWSLQQDVQQGGSRDHQMQVAPAAARPGSMAEKARLAKLPQPAEPSQLKCPRCESTNTKFCYFNNYNLTQPRHFCKTCRRYWTRGGALRSVPVGGGCRRNKRTAKPKAPTSKSPLNVTSTSPSMMTSSAPVVSSSANNGSHQNMPFFHPNMNNNNLSDFGHGFGSNHIHEFQNGSVNLSARFADLWRGQPNFPFFAAGLEQFQAGPQFGPDSVKQEGAMNQQRNFLSINPGNIEETSSYWGTTGGNIVNAWNPDLSAGSTSSTTYLL